MEKKRRDIFPLSKRRLRENEKFCALTPSEKWFWLDVCMFLDDQDKPGVSRWPLAKIARARNIPYAVLKSLADQSVLKGAAEGKTCEALIHTDRWGKEHTLIPAQPGPIWYSSALVRDDYLRSVASKSGRKGGGNPDLSEVGAPIKVRTLGRTYKGLSKGAPKGVSEKPPPSPALSPTTPLSIPTQPPKIPDAAHPAPAVGTKAGETPQGEEKGSEGAATPTQRKPRGERKTTDAEMAVFNSFVEWYQFTAYPAAHEGVEYPSFGGRDAKAVWEVLRCRAIKFDLTKAKALAEYFLRQPDLYGVQGHALHVLVMKLGSWLTGLAKEERNRNVHGNEKRRSSGTGDRGDDFAIPEGRRSARTAGGAGSGDAGIGAGGGTRMDEDAASIAGGRGGVDRKVG